MYLALLTLPLITFFCISLFGRSIGARGSILLSVLSSFLSTLISLTIFYEVAICASPCHISYSIYFNSGLFDANWGFLFDTLTAVMCIVITLISTLVVIYSCSYMIEDPHFIRFLSYLKCFSFAMLVLVTADNYIQLFVGWEGVGLSSFLLISYWFTRLQASKAAIQAMLLNRVGDIGLALGIIGLFFCYNTTNYQALFSINDLHPKLEDNTVILFEIPLLDWACIFLFIGAMGKSGQIALHAWLPNAMNAPTPVSALLHAATMVTAGVFLLARSSPLFEFAPYAAATVTIIGAITTIFAGTIGLVQNDLKSIIAYSTCSQLGYMITICGLSNSNVGIFHLFNHAFIKASLFLTAGVVIHGLANQQDIRKFGGLQQVLVFSYTALLIGTLALVGTPYLSGFYSKDVILELAYARYSLNANFSYLLTSFSVFTTSYYSFRLLFMCFYTGNTHLHKQSARLVHDADWIMGFVLICLALGSTFAGWFFKPMFIGIGTDFWNNSLVIKPSNSMLLEAEFLPQSIKWIPLFNTIMGALLAYAFSTLFVKQTYYYTIRYFRIVYVFFNQRWLFDKLLNEFIAYPSYKLGFRFIVVFDKGLLELLPIFGLGLPRSLKLVYIKLGEMQSGYIYHYATIMIFSAFCALALLSFDNLVPTASLISEMFLDVRLGIIMLASLLVF